jgi:hypothetical protein
MTQTWLSHTPVAFGYSQRSPHTEQFRVSPSRVSQPSSVFWLQSSKPGLQLSIRQTPVEHRATPLGTVQAWLQAPQCCKSEDKSTQAPSQSSRVPGQSSRHPPS